MEWGEATSGGKLGDYVERVADAVTVHSFESVAAFGARILSSGAGAGVNKRGTDHEVVQASGAVLGGGKRSEGGGDGEG